MAKAGQQAGRCQLVIIIIIVGSIANVIHLIILVIIKLTFTIIWGSL